MRKLKLFIAACALLGSMPVSAQTWTGNAVAEGTFFLYNVGAQKFINNGDPNESWGTNAYLQAGFGLDFQFEVSSGAYNLRTDVSNGGYSYYLTTSTWCDGAATPWTFTAVDGETNTYTISNGGSYLVANDALNDVVYGALTNDNKSYWKLVSLDDFKAAMQAKTYSATGPMDVSVFIKGRSFARNDRRNSSWVATHDGGNWTWIGASEDKYYGNEAWNNTFDVHQDIVGLPEGTYEVQCSGFGTNGTTYIYGNNTSKALQTDNTTSYGTNKEAKWKAIHVDNAFAGQSTGTFTVGDGNLTVGIKRETNSGGDWAIWDEFRLYYYGLNLTEFAATLATAVEAAEAVEGTVPMAVYNALAAVVTENNKTYTTAADYTAAANAIVEATNAAKALQTNYARYNSVKNAAKAINASLDTTTPDAEVEAATTDGAIDAAVATLRATFLDALPSLTVPTDPGYIDVTAVMVDNASVNNNANYWTIEGTPNGNYSWGVCNYGECEFYQNNFKFYQTLALTPGTWEFGVTGFHRAGNHKTYFYAGEDKILIPGVESSVVNSMAQAKEYFDAGNGKVALKFLVETAQNVEIGIDNQDTATDKWTIFRDFTLKYYGEPDYSIYKKEWQDALGRANAAISNYHEYEDFINNEVGMLANAVGNAPTDTDLKADYIAKIDALNEAIAAYIAAAKIFESAKLAIDKALAIKEAHNFASEAAITTYTDAINAIKEKYDSRELTREEATAAGTTLGTVVSDWHGNNNAAAVVYLRDGFALGDFEADPALHVNTWSTEGDSDGSGFSVPFYESWTSASKLPESTLTGTLTDLPNGLYKVSAWVRVSSSADAATGITMDVNEGEGEYEAVDVTTGTKIDGSNFTIGTFEAYGLVKRGTLTLNFNIANNNNISWLSFQNVHYTKERDLTPEEEFIAATIDDYGSLNQAIDDAIDNHALGFEAGEYAPYNNVEALTALAAANAIDQEAVNAQADVRAAIDALQNVTWAANDTEVNGFYDGYFTIQTVPTTQTKPLGWNRNSATANQTGQTDTGYETRIVSIPEGVTASNVGMMTKFHSFYGDQEGYTLPLKADTYYTMTFKYAGYNDKPTVHINVYSADGKKVAGTTSFTTKDNQGHNQASSWSEYTYSFKTTEAGNYVIGMVKDTGPTTQKQIAVTDLNLVKTPTVDVTMAVTAAKWATFMAPFDVEIPEGVLAYGVSDAEGNSLTLAAVETTIPANTPVILNSENEVNETVSGQNIATEESYTVGWLTGVYSEIQAPVGSYVLQKLNNKVAFYTVVDGSRPTVGANRAYLTVPSAPAGVRAFFLDGETTGIDAIKALTNGEATIYNTNGVQIPQLQKGMNIIKMNDGRTMKVMVK